jgi:hypothetical protein
MELLFSLRGSWVPRNTIWEALFCTNKCTMYFMYKICPISNNCNRLEF